MLITPVSLFIAEYLRIGDGACNYAVYDVSTDLRSRVIGVHLLAITQRVVRLAVADLLLYFFQLLHQQFFCHRAHQIVALDFFFISLFIRLFAILPLILSYCCGRFSSNDPAALLATGTVTWGLYVVGVVALFYIQ